MAYILWKDGRAYIYDRVDKKPKCMKPLGVIGPREAEDERVKWLADNGKGSASPTDRSMESLREERLRDMVNEDYSEKTIKCFHDCVEPFLETMTRLRELTTMRIEAWDKVLRAWTYKRGANGEPRLLTTETRAHRLRAISSFCAWLVGKKYLKRTPFEVKIPAQRKDAGRALRGSDVLKIFDNWPRGRNSEKQACANLSKLFFQIVFFGGTRLTETLGESDAAPGATYENIDRDHCILKLEKTKGGESREIAMPKSVIDTIPQGRGPIFFGRISDRTLRHYLKMACRINGIGGRFRIHDGRVTAASEWARKNRDPKASMDQFGWKTERMAMHYQKVATEERVAQAQNITYK